MVATAPVRSHRLGSCLLALVALVVACRRTPAPPGAGAIASTATPPGSAYPVSLRDDRGVAVTLRAEPRRIVSLLPSHTETLLALGVGARVVGVDDYSGGPPEAARWPRLGGLYDTHLEQLLSLRPDLVLLSESSSAATPLEQNELTVWAGEAKTYDDVFRVIEAIGTMVDRSSDARQLTERIGREIAEVESRLRGLERVPVYYELDSNLYAAGPMSFVGVLLTKAGGRNVVPAGLGEFPKMSPEAVISGNPSIIFGASLASVTARPGWSQISAVQTGRVYKLPKEESQLVLHSGPRIAEGLRVLARRLHPEVPL
jgi:cobalamin transport system substrate-binding protein